MLAGPSGTSRNAKRAARFDQKQRAKQTQQLIDDEAAEEKRMALLDMHLYIDEWGELDE